MLFNIAVFLVALGILVFVHELGHFVAAKMCGVYVDRFSLGMAPRVFGYRWGETDYCIGLLPIGGYVKMAGQEDVPLEDEERESTYGHVPPERWYNNKTKLQRAFILIAGPAMNIVLAFFIYLGMGFFGGDVSKVTLETRIGQVTPESPASAAKMYLLTEGQQTDFTQEPDAIGWQSGDRILSINDAPMNNFTEIATAAVLNKGQNATIKIERTLPDGTIENYICSVEPLQLNPEMPLTQFGYQPFQAGLINHVLPSSPAADYGLQAQDRIIQLNGQWIDKISFGTQIQELEEDATMTLLVQRGDEQITIPLKTKIRGSFKDIYFTPPLDSIVAIQDTKAQEIKLKDTEFAERTNLKNGHYVLAVNANNKVGTTIRKLMNSNPDAEVEVTLTTDPTATSGTITKVKIADLVKGLTGISLDKQPEIAGISPELAEATNLQRYDTVSKINGEEATIALLQEVKDTKIGETVTLTVERPSLIFGLYQKAKTMDVALTVEPRKQVGVVWDTETVFQKQPKGTLIAYATSECWKRTTEIGQILTKLFTGGLSPKLLGGPVMIFEATANSARSGLYDFFTMLAMISINLGIFNLLPLPVLDGGQLTIIGIEALRGKEVSPQILERFQAAGVFFILGLMLFVTYNDILRAVGRILP